MKLPQRSIQTPAAAADMSFMTLTFSLSFVVMKSHVASMTLLNNSA